MKIRSAKKRDLKEIVEIFVTESKKRPYLQKWTKKKATDDFKPFLKKKELWVAEVDKKVVGFIMIGITSSNKKIAYVNEFWVTKSYQGNGVGKSLLAFAEKDHKKKGVGMIRLTSDSRSKALSFYKKLKYKASKENILLEKKL